MPGTRVPFGPGLTRARARLGLGPLWPIGPVPIRAHWDWAHLFGPIGPIYLGPLAHLDPIKYAYKMCILFRGVLYIGCLGPPAAFFSSMHIGL